MDIFERDLDLNQANYQPLSPIGFLERSAMIYPDKVAIIHGERKITYREYLANAKRLASALSAKGIKKGFGLIPKPFLTNRTFTVRLLHGHQRQLNTTVLLTAGRGII